MGSGQPSPLVMKKYLFYIALLLIPQNGAAQGEDSLRAAHLFSLAEHHSLVLHPDGALFDNPALQTYRYQQSLSEISFGFDYRDESQPLWAELGDGYRGGGFHADSYLCTSANSVVWGEAAYQNGRRDNQRWNENADFDRIYPYVTADTTGGDMKSELYVFRGGYAHHYQRFGYGAQMSYQSGMDYREHDPRPKCTTLNVDFSLGLSYRLDRSYIVSLYGLIGKYNQQQSIAFMNPRGVSMLYHLTGLGTHYYRFKGDRKNSRYDGRQWKLGTCLAPADGMGLSLAYSLTQDHIEKQLADEHNLPLCDIDEWLHHLELTWRRPQFFGRLSGEWRHRLGKEIIYDSGVTFYKKITSLDAFHREVYLATLEGGLLLHPHPKLNLEILPRVLYSNFQSSYSTPDRHSDYSHLTGQTECRLQWFRPQGLWSASLLGGYQAALSNRLQLSDPEDFPAAMATVESNHQIQSSSCTQLEASLRYDLALCHYLHTLFFGLNGSLRHYRTGAQSISLTLSAGIVL